MRDTVISPVMNDMMQSWVDHHPGYELCLWTDGDIDVLDPPLVNLHAYHHNDNHKNHTNILHDYWCVRSLEELHLSTPGVWSCRTG